MAKQLPSAFQPEGVVLPLESILPRRPLKPRVEQSGRYRRIQASIKRLGLVEPFVVYPIARSKGQYLLLDGHLRWHILRKLGVVETICLVATDDEAFTYNHHVCTMNPVQEHLMITRAIREG